MSEDEEDDFRHYMPVLRRIVIVVAVLTAVPVVMWTITAYVRTYVGPPKLPTFQPAAAETTSVPPTNPAAAMANSANALPQAGTVVAEAAPPAVEVTQSTNATPSNAANVSGGDDSRSTDATAAAAPVMAMPPTADSSDTLAPSSTAMIAPNSMPDNGDRFASTQRSGTNWPTPPAMAAASARSGGGCACKPHQCQYSAAAQAAAHVYPGTAERSTAAASSRRCGSRGVSSVSSCYAAGLPAQHLQAE